MLKKAARKSQWPNDTELVGVTLELQTRVDTSLPLNYNYNLHAWFLNQVEKDNPKLSAYLHDGQSEKAFTLSHLAGKFVTKDQHIVLQAGETYCWTITALYAPLCQWLESWLEKRPKTIELRMSQLSIQKVVVAYLPTTYEQLLNVNVLGRRNIQLNFITPTGFRSKGHHLPLPIPSNIFHSYLRRWNDFSNYPFDQNDFLDWVDNIVFINNHDIKSHKVTVGKQGTVTGFTGYVEFGLDLKAIDNLEYKELLYALVGLAPYCGTGHKTTFGLGQTRIGWIELDHTEQSTNSKLQEVLSERIEYLTEIFRSTKKYPDSNRAQQTASTWASILARRELGESLQAISTDLEMPYETVKSYSKLARKALNPIV